jgi:hypothetical protein
MSEVHWGSVALVVVSLLAAVGGYLLAGQAGSIVALLLAMFVGVPLKTAYDERRSRIAALEERVADLESTVERLDTADD